MIEADDQRPALSKNTTDRIIMVPLISDGPNRGFKCVPNPDYIKPLRFYTLDAIEELAREWVDAVDEASKSGHWELRLGMSIFIEWLKRKEKEGR